MQRENPIVKQVGTFTQALYDEATKNGRTVISMKKDWKIIFLLRASECAGPTKSLPLLMYVFCAKGAVSFSLRYRPRN